jgi:hypothetical protein
MSTKTKATPGPWLVEGSSTAHIVSRHTPKGRKVASLLVSTHEDSANAHLIAAAPCLARLLVEVLECGPNVGHNQELLSEIKNALKKAGI